MLQPKPHQLVSDEENNIALRLHYALSVQMM